AAWMPRKSLHGRTCGVSCEGGRARALQQNHTSPRSTADLSAKPYCLAACPAMVGGQGPCSKATHHPRSTADLSAKP
ncbi:hypothetical protein XarCFBP6762_20095, partial [Xanthomonas arboricola]